MPTYFRNSPLLTIDESVFLSIGNEPKECEQRNKHDDEGYFASNNEEVGRESGNSPSYSHEEHDGAKSGKCSRVTETLTLSIRSDLQVLQDFTYLSKDHSAVAKVASMIKETVTVAKSLLPVDSGLVLRPTPQKKNIKGILQSASTSRPLPSRKCRRRLSLFDRYKKRVGRAADRVKRGAFVSLDVTFEPQPKRRCINKTYGKELVTNRHVRKSSIKNRKKYQQSDKHVIIHRQRLIHT